jgi:hypothetical protein
VTHWTRIAQESTAGVTVTSSAATILGIAVRAERTR